MNNVSLKCYLNIQTLIGRHSDSTIRMWYLPEK